MYSQQKNLPDFEGLKEQLACAYSVHFKHIPVNQQKEEPLPIPLQLSVPGS